MKSVLSFFTRIAVTLILALLGAEGDNRLIKPASAELSSSQEKGVTALIERYIRENPSIIRDSLARLATEEERALKQAAFSILSNDVNDPVIGPADASLTIYEFSDYNCGYCKRLFPTMMEVITEESDIKLVIKELPIVAESSLAAAQAGIAAQQQQKFPDFHEALMNWRGKTDDSALLAAARTAGLDISQWRSDMASPETARILQRSQQAAMALNLRGTPALVIGSQVIPGAVPKEQIMRAIAEARKNP